MSLLLLFTQLSFVHADTAARLAYGTETASGDIQLEWGLSAHFDAVSPSEQGRAYQAGNPIRIEPARGEATNFNVPQEFGGLQKRDWVSLDETGQKQLTTLSFPIEWAASAIVVNRDLLTPIEFGKIETRDWPTPNEFSRSQQRTLGSPLEWSVFIKRDYTNLTQWQTSLVLDINTRPERSVSLQSSLIDPSEQGASSQKNTSVVFDYAEITKRDTVSSNERSISARRDLLVPTEFVGSATTLFSDSRVPLAFAATLAKDTRVLTEPGNTETISSTSRAEWSALLRRDVGTPEQWQEVQQSTIQAPVSWTATFTKDQISLVECGEMVLRGIFTPDAAVLVTQKDYGVGVETSKSVIKDYYNPLDFGGVATTVARDIAFPLAFGRAVTRDINVPVTFGSEVINGEVQIEWGISVKRTQFSPTEELFNQLRSIKVPAEFTAITFALAPRDTKVSFEFNQSVARNTLGLVEFAAKRVVDKRSPQETIASGSTRTQDTLAPIEYARRQARDVFIPHAAGMDVLGNEIPVEWQVRARVDSRHLIEFSGSGTTSALGRGFGIPVEYTLQLFVEEIPVEWQQNVIENYNLPDEFTGTPGLFVARSHSFLTDWRQTVTGNNRVPLDTLGVVFGVSRDAAALVDWAQRVIKNVSIPDEVTQVAFLEELPIEWQQRIIADAASRLAPGLDVAYAELPVEWQQRVIRNVSSLVETAKRVVLDSRDPVEFLAGFVANLFVDRAFPLEVNRRQSPQPTIPLTFFGNIVIDRILRAEWGAARIQRDFRSLIETTPMSVVGIHVIPVEWGQKGQVAPVSSTARISLDWLQTQSVSVIAQLEEEAGSTARPPAPVSWGLGRQRNVTVPVTFSRSVSRNYTVPLDYGSLQFTLVKRDNTVNLEFGATRRLDTTIPESWITSLISSGVSPEDITRVVVANKNTLTDRGRRVNRDTPVQLDYSAVFFANLARNFGVTVEWGQIASDRFPVNASYPFALEWQLAVIANPSNPAYWTAPQTSNGLVLPERGLITFRNTVSQSEFLISVLQAAGAPVDFLRNIRVISSANIPIDLTASTRVITSTSMPVEHLFSRSRDVRFSAENLIKAIRTGRIPLEFLALGFATLSDTNLPIEWRNIARVVRAIIKDDMMLAAEIVKEVLLTSDLVNDTITVTLITDDNEF